MKDKTQNTQKPPVDRDNPQPQQEDRGSDKPNQQGNQGNNSNQGNRKDWGPDRTPDKNMPDEPGA